MEHSVIPIFLEQGALFRQSELDNLDKSLDGIYVLYNLKVTERSRDAIWVYWGAGNIYDGLTQFISNPCNLQFIPEYFSYTTKFGASEQKLHQIRSELGQLCTFSTNP